MTFNAAMFARKRETANQSRGNKSGFRYQDVVLRPIQQTWQLVDIREVEDKRYGKPKYGFQRISFVFALIVPGAEKAETADEQNKYRKLGHGKFLSIDVDPICSPPGRRKGKDGKTETINPSALYSVLSVLLNDGEPLTNEQLGRADDDTIKEFMREWNAAGNEPKLSKLDDGRVYFAAQVVAEHLEALKAAKPFVYATPAVKTRVDEDGQPLNDPATGKPSQYNKLYKLDALVPAEIAESLSPYKPYPRPLDPRNADDDPNITCDTCGEVIRGFENREGEWLHNSKVAEMSRENWGGDYCGRCIRKMKDERDSGDDF